MRIYNCEIERWNRANRAWDNNYARYHIITNGGGLCEAIRKANARAKKEFGRARVRGAIVAAETD